MRKVPRLISLGTLAALLLLWESFVRLREVPALILPAPSRIAANLWRHTASGYLLKHLSVTLIEIGAGFVLGACLGIGLGLLVSRSTTVYQVIQPYIIASQAMPKLALAPLLVIWFGYGLTPKIVITALVCFFPVFESTTAGLRYVDPAQLSLFRSYRATEWQILIKLRWPTAIPYVFSGLRAAIVLSVVGAVISEFIGASRGLGAVIVAAQGMMDTTLIFSSFITLTLIGIGLYQGCRWVEEKLLRQYTLYRRIEH